MFTIGRRELAALDQSFSKLAKARSLHEIKMIRDEAEAARVHAKAARRGVQLQNRAAELKLRAERKAGRLLRSLKLRGGDRRSNRRNGKLRLAHLGIFPHQSKRWQQVARVTDEQFARYLTTMHQQNRPITSAGLLRFARKGIDEAPTTETRSRAICFARIDRAMSQEMLEEIMNHSRLLGDVLRPICESERLVLTRGEKRVVCRLVAEKNGLAMKLRDSWPTWCD